MLETNAFLLIDESDANAVLVDAPDGAAEWVREMLPEGCKLTHLLLTHGHFDHMGGAAEVVETYGVPALGHRDDEHLFTNPKMQLDLFGLPGKLPPVQIDQWLEHGQKMELLGTSCEVRHVPGHCPGNVAFCFQAEGVAIVGDTLFAGGVGRWDLPGGDWPTLNKSIRGQLLTLPDETRILPGHGPETTVGQERAHNPYIQND